MKNECECFLFAFSQVLFHIALVEEMQRIISRTCACLFKLVQVCTHTDSCRIVESASGTVEERRKKITRPPNISDSSRTEE